MASPFRCWRALRYLALVPVVLSLLGTTPGTGQAAGPQLERWGFYVTYDASSKTSVLSHLNQLDVVVPDYFSLQPSGVISSSADSNLDAQVVANGPRLFPMVQTAVTNDALTPFLADPSRRSATISAIVQRLSAGPYSGLTLDFEGVSPRDRPQFTRFVQDLAEALHATGKSLAVAVPASDGKTPSSWSAAFDYAAIGSAADRVVVMAYAYRTAANPVPGPISPLPWVKAVAAYAASQIPPSRLLLGIGLWGYDWNLSQPGRATALLYGDIVNMRTITPSTLQFDPVNAEPWFAYQNAGQNHQVWFEDASSVQQKLSVGVDAGYAGVAVWRLGQEAPGLWSDLTSTQTTDYAIPGGWFFAETGGGGGLGYKVVDDTVKFWTEFQRLGGVATLGYPSSRRYVGADGFTYQVFQRGILQWRPEIGEAYLANTFDMLTASGRDSALADTGIPRPIVDDGSGGDWDRAREIRLGWLSDPTIAATFYANPNRSAIAGWDESKSIQLYGLPASKPYRSGPFIVQRFQRISLQLWVDNVSGMPSPGSVVGILGGDLVKSAGIVPSAAASPEYSG